MATVSKYRRLSNPGRKRRRKMSPKQIAIFGTKRQKAALKNRGRRRKNISRYSAGKRYRRRRNVSSIITVRTPNPSRRRRRNRSYRKRRNYGTKVGRSWSTYSPKTKKKRKNPSRRRRNRSKKIIVVNMGGKMVRRRRRTNRSYRRKNRSYRRRRNYGRVRNYSRRRRHNTYHRRRRRSNPGGRRRHYGRRRNPGIMSGTAGRIVGVLGGIAVTKTALALVPAQFTGGVMTYLAGAVIAFAQGKLIGKVFKNEQLGNDFMVGGFAYVVATMLNAFIPTVGAYTGISGMRGMGLLGGSSFYLPQVNQNGSMGSFVVPAAVMGAMPVAPASSGGGMGSIRGRRVGRLS